MTALPQTDAWSVDEHQLDSTASTGEKLRFALRYAVLAPSNHNTQPWHFILDGDSATLCADRLRALPVVDPFDRELIIGCGAALFNLRVALSHFRLAYAITLFPSGLDPDALAHVQIVPDGHCDAALAPLLPAILKRVTTREIFRDEPLPLGALQQLVDAAEAEGADAVCVSSAPMREKLAELVAEADRIQFDDPRFRRELASWIHPRRREDGMPALSDRITAVLDLAAPLFASVIRTFDLGGGLAAAHHALVEGSPLLICLATSTDDAAAWLSAGQALERLLLVAANAGITASYLNQPTELSALRERLRTTLMMDTVPQLLLRVGRGRPAAHSPRRPLPEVVS
ncbi:Acg family FMN-binding oxidoreductase [Paraburkholderia kirstenboschensis]|uniref:Nitroreductase family protein n=1 Tax=Paraburkholderia kirstenboschensis TaxID=1245436 RepID=A0ABZ0EHD7_9BURK|nr:nitroreductase family protein [Paraburkholderia kirstenboschensis]WOD15578.1 nitroreductase family protein [Paraburkholderia kirstenboschensis]